jgi:hypothetical protein
VFRYADAEDAKCNNPAHERRDFEVHHHRSTVVLQDGTKVTAASFDNRDGYARDYPPHYGLYLDRRWQPPWPHDHLDWPDGGVPVDTRVFLSALGSLRDRARDGQTVEVGCIGGHGRTGTALAGLAILSGVPREQAVSWVRTNYCPSAIETAEQEAFVLRLGADDASP